MRNKNNQDKSLKCRVEISTMDIKVLLTKLKCFVRLQRLNIIQFHHKIIHVKRCRVNINKTPCTIFLKQLRANIIKELLDKLESETEQRDKLLLQGKGKVLKTRNSYLYQQGKDCTNTSSYGAQESFLSNFNLMPSEDSKTNQDLPVDHNQTKNAIEEQSSVSKNPTASHESPIIREAAELRKRRMSESKEEEGLVPVKSKRKLLDIKQTSEPKKYFLSSIRVELKKLNVGISSTQFYSKSAAAETIECPECNKTFIKTGHLKNHMKAVHGDQKLVSCANNECPPNSNTEFYCSPCKIPFSTMVSLRKHRIVHHKISYNDVNMKETTDCQECGKHFQCLASLKRHVMTEHQGHKTQCPKCGVHVSRLDNHMATVHQQTRVTCPMCSVLLVPTHVARHVKTVHLGIRQRCVLCDKFISNIHKHTKSVHGVDHNDHTNCACIIYYGPHWSKC